MPRDATREQTPLKSTDPVATPKMNQDWRQIRDRIKAMWPGQEFDDARMKKARGSLRQMVTLIHEKTEEPRLQIRRKIAAVM